MRAQAALMVAGIGLAGCIPAASDRRPQAAPPPAQASVPARGQAAPGTPQPTVAKGDGVTTLPTAPPAWEARSVAPDAAAVPAQRYTVAPGDTLRAIGQRTGAGAEAIARANGLATPFLIFPGQQLNIPGGRYHQVRDGQTGIAIARAYAVEWQRIVAANALDEPYILRTGQRILIPGTDAPRSVAERAAAFRLDIEDILTGGEPAIEANERPARATASPRRVLPSTAAVAAPAGPAGSIGWPVEGRILKRFGAGDSGERNDGIKIGVALNTPVLAAADGTVAYVGTGVPGLGGVVIVKHGGTLASVYGHASQLLVQRGQSVKRGQKIALSGDSGYADRPQLHFELRQGRTPVDPTQRLPRR